MTFTPPTRRPALRRSRHNGVNRVRCLSAIVLGCVGIIASIIWCASDAAQAAQAADRLVAVSNLNQVIVNLRNVIIGLSAGLATLFATVGGIRYILGGGDPGEVEAAKKSVRNSAIGYGIAVMAPVLVRILQQIVGA
ncbi:pilin [Actinomadura gamaensis]|uniref:Pilin n=1 Tax=Actinomadura gamaensis TaxID=1763541 RepID=A0ABV9UD14_9ACTN